MGYTVQNVLTDLSGVIHGTTTNKIPNVYGALNRAARAVLLDVDPKETQRIVSLSQTFNEVYDYPCPIDLKGDRIIDIRPQAGRTPFDQFTQGYAEDFDTTKYVSFDQQIYTQWNTGVKTLRISNPTLTSPVVLSDTSSVTGWSATPGAQNISLDTQYNVAGGGDITFDLASGSSSGYIQNSTLTSININNYRNIGVFFMWVYLPSASSVSSVDLRWGSDVSNYWNLTTSVTQQNTAFVTGWNLLAFPWVSATQTGTPNASSLSMLRVTVNYNSTVQTGVKVCNIQCALGYIYQIQYYSKFLFRDPSTNAFQETVIDSTDNNKLVNLDTESYNLFFNKVAYFVAQQLQGADAAYDATYWDTEYQNALRRYKAQNPSEAKDKGAFYYSLPQKSYNRFLPSSLYPGGN